MRYDNFKITNVEEIEHSFLIRKFDLLYRGNYVDEDVYYWQKDGKKKFMVGRLNYCCLSEVRNTNDIFDLLSETMERYLKEKAY